MSEQDERRRELGSFLQQRRRHLVRADYGLPTVGRQRSEGLRREEVAVLAGVSVTWYTWLEQGRRINPSRQVLTAVADTLRVSDSERNYVLGLAGFSPGTSSRNSPTPILPAHLRRLLTAQDPAPAFAVAADGAIIGWNGSYEWLYPTIATTPVENRFLLWLIFTDHQLRQMLPDWPAMSRQFVAEFRSTARLDAHGTHHDWVSRLQAISPEFDAAWSEHKVSGFENRTREFAHPQAGRLVFEQHRVIPADTPDIHLVIYLPVDQDCRERVEAGVTAATSEPPRD